MLHPERPFSGYPFEAFGIREPRSGVSSHQVVGKSFFFRMKLRGVSARKEYKKHTMTFAWNPFSMAEFDDSKIVVRLPNSGHFAQITGPIVELLSQLPFAELESALESWQNRTGIKDASLRKAVTVWRELQDGGVILRLPQGDAVKSNISQGMALDNKEGPSHLFRFVDAQDLQFEEDDHSASSADADEEDFWFNED